MLVHLVRHGQTIWHADGRYAGLSDIPLTPLGEQQAQLLATWAAGQPISRLVVSDRQRAVHTATPAAEALGIELEVDGRWREVDFGEGDGRTLDEMRGVFPDAVDAYLARPATHPLPGAEHGVEVVARAGAALVDAVRATTDGDLLVVAHTTLFRLLLARLLGVPLDDYRRVFRRLDNAAVTTIELPGDAADALAIEPGAEWMPRAALIRLNQPLG